MKLFILALLILFGWAFLMDLAVQIMQKKKGEK